MNHNFENGTLQFTLEEVKHRYYIEMSPVLAYLSLLIVLGTVGNSFVIYIYKVRFPKCSSSYFILCLAVVDLLTSTVGIPFDIIDILYWYDFRIPVICKLLRFITYITVGESIVILIIVVIDRYYKICQPLKRLSLRSTKILIFLSAGFALLFSWPTLFLFGSASSHLAKYNFTSTQCSVRDSLANTAYPILYYITLGCVFMAGVIFMSVMYIKIVYRLSNQNKRLSRTLSKNSIPRKTTRLESINEDVSVFEAQKNSNFRCGSRRTNRLNSSQSSDTVISFSNRKNINIERTTAVFLTVSCGFILSYFPSLIIMIIQLLNDDYRLGNFPNLVSQVIYEIFLRAYFINTVVNPFIYGFMNPRFRNELSVILRKLCSNCRNIFANIKIRRKMSNRVCELPAADNKNKEIDQVFTVKIENP